MIRIGLKRIRNWMIPYLYELGLWKKDYSEQYFYKINPKQPIKYWFKQTQAVEVVFRGKKVTGYFDYSLGDYCQLQLTVPGEFTIERIGFSLFDALQRIRLVTELENIQLCCYGARVNSYVTGMIGEMGQGTMCFLFTIGQDISPGDLRETLGPCPEGPWGSVREQNKRYKEYIKKRGRTGGNTSPGDNQSCLTAEPDRKGPGCAGL